MAGKAPDENVVQFSRLGYHSGVLPDHRIVAMAEEGHIRADEAIEENQYQPASLDLRLGSTAYRIRASFLPGASASVDTRVAEFSLHKFNIEQGAILETGCVYLIPLIELLALPDDLHAAANPKSSTGRLDVFTRLICDSATTFDTIPVGYPVGSMPRWRPGRSASSCAEAPGSTKSVCAAAAQPSPMTS